MFLCPQLNQNPFTVSWDVLPTNTHRGSYKVHLPRQRASLQTDLLFVVFFSCCTFCSIFCLQKCCSAFVCSSWSINFQIFPTILKVVIFFRECRKQIKTTQSRIKLFLVHKLSKTSFVHIFTQTLIMLLARFPTVISFISSSILQFQCLQQRTC